MQPKHLSNSLWSALIYGVLHALVDAVTVTTTYAACVRYRVSPDTALVLVLMYDLIAFASQPFLGWAADRFRLVRGAAGVGMILCIASALLLPAGPFVAAVTAGIGNALFHLGGGVVSMSLQPGRAAGPGIFVGPGTLGLAFGIFYGPHADAVPTVLIVALGVGLAVPLFLPHPETMSEKNFPYKEGSSPLGISTKALALGILLVSIFFRSLVGHGGSRECPKIPPVLFGLAAAGCLGKMMGGLLSDKFGWMSVSVGALLVATPLIAFGGPYPILIGIGGGLFQMTMPVSLVAAASILPGRPALVFGLNCLAFIGGALPVFTGVIVPYYSSAAFLVTSLAGVAAVYFGLRLLKPRTQMQY